MINNQGENYTSTQEQLFNESLLQVLEIQLESVKWKIKEETVSILIRLWLIEQMQEIKADINRIMWKK